MIFLVALFVYLALFAGVEIMDDPVLLAAWVGFVLLLFALGVYQVKPSEILKCRDGVSGVYLILVVYALIVWWINGAEQGGMVVLSFVFAGFVALGVAKKYTLDQVYNAIIIAGYFLAFGWLFTPLVQSGRNIDALWFGLWFVVAAQKRDKLTLFLAAVMLVIVGSRAGFVVAALGVFLVYKPKLHWRDVGIVSLVAVGLVAIRVQTILNRFGSWQDSLGVMGSSSLGELWIGRGPGWVQMSGAVLDMGRLSPHAHNLVLQIVLELGLFGLLLVCWLAWNWYTQGAKSWQLVLPLLVVGLFDFPWHMPGIIVLTSFLIGGNNENL
jgi:hypothetical protein